MNNGFSADTECIKTVEGEYRKSADAILELNHEHYISIILELDDGSVSFMDELAESMHGIGWQYGLKGCYHQGYIVIIDGGKAVCETLGEERLEYPNNQRGMNIVINDKEQQKIVDSTIFDTRARDCHYVVKLIISVKGS